MAYTIQDSAERAAFERWGDLTAQLIRKYGPALLEKLDRVKLQYGMTEDDDGV